LYFTNIAGCSGASNVLDRRNKTCTVSYRFQARVHESGNGGFLGPNPRAEAKMQRLWARGGEDLTADFTTDLTENAAFN